MEIKVGSYVLTPKGVAEVYNITPDDGIYTSKGTFCRTELLETNIQKKDFEKKELELKLHNLYKKMEERGLV